MEIAKDDTRAGHSWGFPFRTFDMASISQFSRLLDRCLQTGKQENGISPLLNASSNDCHLFVHLETRPTSLRVQYRYIYWSCGGECDCDICDCLRHFVCRNSSFILWLSPITKAFVFSPARCLHCFTTDSEFCTTCVGTCETNMKHFPVNGAISQTWKTNRFFILLLGNTVQREEG